MEPETLLAHDPFARALARSLVFGHEEADDVVQDAWVRALRRPPRPGPGLKGWFAAAFRSVLADRRRASLRRRARETAAAGAEATTDAFRETEEARREVVDAVLALDAKSREVVLLRFFEDLPPREIAARLDVPVETVKTRLKRALSRLRAALDDRRDGDRRAWALALLPLARRGSGAGLLTTGALVLVPLLVLAAVAVALVGTPSASAPSPAARVVDARTANGDGLTGADASDSTPARARGDAATARIRGRVVSRLDERPVAGAVVVWRLAEMVLGGDRPKGRTTTDDEGRYELVGVPPGRIFLAVRGGGWVSEALLPPANPMEGLRFGTDDPAQIEIGADRAVERDLVAVRAGVAAGRVLGPDGRGREGVPVVAAEVELSMGSWDRGFAPGEWNLRTRTGESGAYRLDALLPGTRYVLRAMPSGGGPAAAGPISAAGGETLEIDLRLPPPRTLDVLVVDADTGRPVSRARVRVEMPGPSMNLGDETGQTLETDGEGRARAKALPAGELLVTTGHDSFLEDRVRVGPEETRLRIGLVRGREIAGSVAWPDGSPAEKVAVFADPIPARTGGKQRRAESDEEGRFALRGLAPAAYRVLAVTRRDGRELRASADALAGSEGVRLVLAPSEALPRPGDLTVRVVDPSGAPVPRGRVLFHEFAPSGHGWSVETIEDGRAKGETGYPDRERWIEVMTPADANRHPLPLGAALVGPVPKGEHEITVRLAPEKSIEGRVVDRAGRAVAGARVRAEPVLPELPGPRETEDPHAVATTDEAGRFRLGRLGDRDYRVRVEPPDEYAPPAPLVRAAGATDLTISVGPAASPVVTVVDAAGRPVAGALVFVTEPPTGEAAGDLADFPDLPPGVFGPKALADARTDAEGRARLPGLAPGASYRLTVQPPASRTDLGAAVERDWRPADSRVRLAAGAPSTRPIEER